MTQDALTLKTKINTLRQLIDKSKEQIALALPRHMTAERLMRVAVTAIQRSPKLLDCTPVSVLGAIIQSAQLGLEPDGVLGHAYLVPYGTTCQFIPGYRGLVDLVRRSGQISTFEARAVHAKDKFEYSFGLQPKLDHVPSELGDPGELIAVYAVCRLKDGGYQFDVMLRREVEAIRRRSKTKETGPWVTDFDEMAKKTVVRRLCKLLPVSVEAQRAVALDERAELGIDQELNVIDLETAPAVPGPEEVIAPELSFFPLETREDLKHALMERSFSSGQMLTILRQHRGDAQKVLAALGMKTEAKPLVKGGSLPRSSFGDEDSDQAS